jgi:hypothetical protein
MMFVSLQLKSNCLITREGETANISTPTTQRQTTSLAAWGAAKKYTSPPPPSAKKMAKLSKKLKN